jgi:hypothetical protein
MNQWHQKKEEGNHGFDKNCRSAGWCVPNQHQRQRLSAILLLNTHTLSENLWGVGRLSGRHEERYLRCTGVKLARASCQS